MNLLAVVAWHISLPVILGLLGIYLLLPRPRPYPRLWGALCSGAALVVAGWLLIRGGLDAQTVLFYAFSAIAVLGGGMLVTQRNPVHAALSFALVVLSTCGLFLLQAAPFLMAATIIVYAGAIIVTFLFVIMLAQQEGRSDADERSREPLLSTVASFVLLATLLYVLQRSYDTQGLNTLVARAQQAEQQGSAPAIASTLGDEDKFFESFRQAVAQAWGSPDLPSAEEVTEVQSKWITAAHPPKWDPDRKPDVAAMQEALGRLVDIGMAVHQSFGKLQPHGDVVQSTFSVIPTDLITPGETVAPLGRALFTDYLIAVELAGTLLLVATIGAIAVVSRRTEALR